MSNILNNTTSLQQVLEALQNKAAGGGDPVLQDKTVTPTLSQQTITADGGYDGLDTVTVEAMPTAVQATPSITVDASGVITAKATQTAGYVAAGTKSSTYSLAFQAAQTITPNTANQIAVSSGYYTGGDITVKGDSNLVADNIKSGVSIFGVSGTYEGSGSSSGEVDYSGEDAIITRTISGTYANDRVKSIGSYAFRYCNSLTSVNFPVCTNIGEGAFYSCSSLTSVNFPVCTSIGETAFNSCRSLISVNFPVCTKIGRVAFYSCSSLTSVNFPVCTNIASSAFNRCSSLTSVNFPVCTNIASSAFGHCNSLTSVNFPVCTNIGSYAFYYCDSLTSVNFPVCTNIGGRAFNYCSSLISAYFGSDIPSTSTTIKAYIHSSAFSPCSKLTNLTLYHPSVAILSNVNAFYSTPMSVSTLVGSFGSIYVPASLVDAYKSATNWTTYADRITAIEGDSGGDSGDTENGEGEVVLTSISATYSGGIVPVGTAIDTLTGITVTAHYSDGSSETVTNYTLSGNINNVGDNVITVTYNDKTTTFIVTGFSSTSSGGSGGSGGAD